MKRLEEKRLVYRVVTESDRDAFAALYDLFVDRIYRFVYLKVSHKEAAEDITSDVFLKTWRYLTSPQKGKKVVVESFSGFIYQTARNAVVDYYRKRAQEQEDRNEKQEATEASGQEIEQIIETHREIETKTEIDRMYGAIKQLKQEYQEAVLLRYADGLSCREIAKILKRSEISTRVTLYRALRVLKNMLGGSL